MIRFAPYAELAGQLLACCAPSSADGAHDLSHLQRVWANVRQLQREEGGDLELLLAAVLLHDCVAVEKDSPLRSSASRLSAARAGELLAGLGWPAGRSWRDRTLEGWKRSSAPRNLREKLASHPWQQHPCTLRASIDPGRGIETYYRGQEARGIQATPRSGDFDNAHRRETGAERQA